MDDLVRRGRRDEASNCLLWPTESCDEQGYGHVKWNGKRRLVHRVVLMHKLGITELDPKIFARHSPKCISRACFERDHIQAGTRRQNNYDDRIAAGTLLRGEKNYNATISDDLAMQIKHSFYPQGHELYLSKRTRANRFGVALYMVKNIDFGQSHAHIPDREGNVTDNLERRDKKCEANKRAKEREFSSDLVLTGRKRLFERSYLSTETSYNGISCRLFKKVSKDGYGRVHVLGRHFLVHQLACAIKTGRFREECEDTRHLCNVRACVEETHLEFGSRSDNAKDSREYKKSSKLNMKKVNLVKEMYTTKQYTQAQLAVLFGVSRATIGNVVRGKSWV